MGWIVLGVVILAALAVVRLASPLGDPFGDRRCVCCGKRYLGTKSTGVR